MGTSVKWKKINKHKKLIQKYFLKKIKTKTNHNWWEEKRIEYHKRRKKKKEETSRNILSTHTHTHTQKHQNVQNFFSPIISTIWRNWVLVGPGRKTLGPSSFLSPLSSQSNSHFNHFLPTFLFFIFYSPTFHSNQTSVGLRLPLQKDPTLFSWKDLKPRNKMVQNCMIMIGF